MKRIFLLIMALGCFALSRGQSLSPTVIASSGAFYSNSSGSLSWTLGECATTFIGPGYTLSQGFQQSYTTVTAVEQLPQSGFSVLAFPNPASDKLHVRIENTSQGTYRLYLMDVLGRVQYQASQSGSGALESEIDMHALSKGMYFLHIYSGSKELNTTKIEHLN